MGLHLTVRCSSFAYHRSIILRQISALSMLAARQSSVPTAVMLLPFNGRLLLQAAIDNYSPAAVALFTNAYGNEEAGPVNYPCCEYRSCGCGFRIPLQLLSWPGRYRPSEERATAFLPNFGNSARHARLRRRTPPRSDTRRTCRVAVILPGPAAGDPWQRWKVPPGNGAWRGWLPPA